MQLFCFRAVSTRLVAACWWFFTLIMVSSYTANLAAFLTTEDADPAFESAKQLAERAESENIAYGALAKGATAAVFLQALVSYQCLSLVFVTSICHGYLSQVLVTVICHKY